MWEIGQKCICITNNYAVNNQSRIYKETAPQKDQELTIRTIESDSDGTFLRFEEIKNESMEYRDGRGEVMFCSLGFAPFDININELTEVLNEELCHTN